MKEELDGLDKALGPDETHKAGAVLGFDQFVPSSMPDAFHHPVAISSGAAASPGVARGGSGVAASLSSFPYGAAANASSQVAQWNDQTIIGFQQRRVHHQQQQQRPGSPASSSSSSSSGQSRHQHVVITAPSDEELWLRSTGKLIEPTSLLASAPSKAVYAQDVPASQASHYNYSPHMSAYAFQQQQKEAAAAAVGGGGGGSSKPPLPWSETGGERTNYRPRPVEGSALFYQRDVRLAQQHASLESQIDSLAESVAYNDYDHYNSAPPPPLATTSSAPSSSSPLSARMQQTLRNSRASSSSASSSSSSSYDDAVTAAAMASIAERESFLKKMKKMRTALIASF